jgi:hypothetical protein
MVTQSEIYLNIIIIIKHNGLQNLKTYYLGAEVAQSV